MPSLLKRKRDRTRRSIRSSATTTNFYHSLSASYDNTLSRLATRGTNQSTESSPCHLMRLPTELRLQIYEYVLRSSASIVVQQPFGITQKPHLLTVSKTIRHEALPLYYTLNTFSIALYMDQFPTAAHWLARRINDTGGKPLTKVRFTIWCIKWESVPALIPLLEMIWNGSVILDFGRMDCTWNSDGRTQDTGPFLAANQSGIGHLQSGMLAAAKSAQQVGIEGGSMVDVIDATAAAFGHAASLSKDRRFYVVMREYSLYHELVRLRDGYAESRDGNQVPGKSCAKTYRQICRKRERKSMYQRQVRSGREQGESGDQRDREQCAEIYEILCRGTPRALSEEGRKSTKG